MHPLQPISSISSTIINTSQITTPATASFPQIAHIANAEELPSASQDLYLLAAVSEQCSEEFQFNVARKDVDDDFWHKFKNELKSSDFDELFNSFLLTNWEPKETYKYNFRRLPRNITEIKKEKGEPPRQEDIISDYDSLVETFLCANLKLRAASLIHTMMDVGNLNAKLKTHPLANEAEVIKKRDRKTECINSQYRLAFYKVHSLYQSYLKKADAKKTAADIISLRSHIRSFRNSVSRFQKGINDTKLMEKHLPFINQCLINLRLYRKIPVYTKASSSVIPSSVTVCKQAEKSIQPPAKKRRILPAAFLQSTTPISTLIQPEHSSEEKKEAAASSQKTAQHQNEMICSKDSLDMLSSSAASLCMSGTSAESLLYTADEVKFISLLNKMTGKDTYFYFEINIDGEDEKNENVMVNLEKYYHSAIMLSALSAKILLLKIKILTVGLIQSGILNIRKKLREKFFAFVNNHLIYEKNMEELLNKKNQLPEGMTFVRMRRNYFANCRNIKDMNITLEAIQQEYNEVIQNYDEDVLLKRYGEFISSAPIISRIKNSYSLSNMRMNQIMQIFLNIPLVSNLTQQQFSSLKFQTVRPPVDDSFWQALKDEDLSESEFRHRYFSFILTNWRSPLDVIYELDKAIKQATNKFDITFRANLVEKHFQEKLKYQAFILIHHILQVIGKYERLKKLSPDEKQEIRRIEYQIDTTFDKIRENYRNTLTIYSGYLIARKSLANVDVASLHREMKTCQNYMYNHTRSDIEETELYILLINDILEQNDSFTFSTAPDLIRNYINYGDKTCETPTFIEASNQLQFVPSVSVEGLSEQSTTSRLHFASSLNAQTS